MDNEKSKILIPMIRKYLPNIMAQNIVGVQPMIVEQKIETGETYEDEASSYATDANTVEWYWVRLPMVPGAIFNIDLQQQHLEEVTKWCWDSFGNPQLIDSVWVTMGSRFCFKNAADRTAFVLKWG